MLQFLDALASQAPTPVHPYNLSGGVGGSLNFGLPTIWSPPPPPLDLKSVRSSERHVSPVGSNP